MESTNNGLAPIQEIIKQSVSRNQLQGTTPRGKLPPQALDLEQCVLGAVILEKEAIYRALDIIDTADVFYKPAHVAVYQAALDLINKNQPIDLMTIKNQLESSGNLEMVGGIYYLTELTERVANSANIEHHARIIVQKWVAREGIKIAQQTINDLYDDTTEDVFEVIDANRAELDRLASITAKGVVEDLTENPMDTIKAFEEAAQKRKEAEAKGIDFVPGLGTGLKDLDYITDGFGNEHLWYLGARPAMGKTGLGVNRFARNFAFVLGVPGLVFQLEMSNKQQKQRLHCSIAMVSAQKGNNGLLTEKEIKMLMDATKELDKGGIHSDDRTKQTILTIRAVARKFKREKNIGWILLDNKDIISSSGKSFSREREVADISRSLMELAKVLEIPIIALSQLSRACETRPGSNEPTKSDLRDSGACEQDAHGVILLYRPSYYGKKYCETYYKDVKESLENAGFVPWWDTFKHLAFLRVDKNRGGATGTAIVWFDHETVTFRTIEDAKLRETLGIFTPHKHEPPVNPEITTFFDEPENKYPF